MKSTICCKNFTCKIDVRNKVSEEYTLLGKQKDLVGVWDGMGGWLVGCVSTFEYLGEWVPVQIT